jgi:hypothetical protein
MNTCSVCNEEFETEEAYLNHTCTTDFKPTEFEHQVKLNPAYEAISKAALERGKKQ